MLQSIDISLTAKLYKEHRKHMSPSKVVTDDISNHALKMFITVYIDKQFKFSFLLTLDISDNTVTIQHTERAMTVLPVV